MKKILNTFILISLFTLPVEARRSRSPIAKQNQVDASGDRARDDGDRARDDAVVPSVVQQPLRTQPSQPAQASLAGNGGDRARDSAVVPSVQQSVDKSAVNTQPTSAVVSSQSGAVLDVPLAAGNTVNSTYNVEALIQIAQAKEVQAIQAQKAAQDAAKNAVKAAESNAEVKLQEAEKAATLAEEVKKIAESVTALPMMPVQN